MADKMLVTSKVAVFVFGGKSYSVQVNEESFRDVVALLKSGNTAKAVKRLGAKNPTRRVKIQGNDLYFDGNKFEETFAEAYAVAQQHGLSVAKLELFFKNLSMNPSPISVHAFSSFLAKSRMPITDRGTFLAYKMVSEDFFDFHSGHFDNRPGCVVQMRREDVDENQSHTCSTGFHVCSYEYLQHFGCIDNSNIVVCEIHPADVVAVPPDYAMTKMRCASYRVLCTLNYFKKKLLTYEADALGRIPIFNTADFRLNWHPLEDVKNKEKSNTYMKPKKWLESRVKAVQKESGKVYA